MSNRFAISVPTFISILIAVGAVYQTVTLLVLQHTIPQFSVEFGLVDDHCEAVRER